MGNWNSCKRPSGLIMAFSIYFSIYLIFRTVLLLFTSILVDLPMFFAPEMMVLALEFHFSRLRHIFSHKYYFYSHSRHLFQFARSSDFNLPFQFTVRSWLFNLPPTIRDFNLPIDCPSGNVDLPSVWDFNLPSQHDFNLPSDNFNLPGHLPTLWFQFTVR